MLYNNELMLIKWIEMCVFKQNLNHNHYLIDEYYARVIHYLDHNITQCIDPQNLKKLEHRNWVEQYKLIYNK